MKMDANKKRLLAITSILLFGAIASITISLWVTENGIGVSPDSTKYLHAGRNFVAGEGLTVQGEPLTHYPPVYPILLGIANYFDIKIIEPERLFHALLYALNAVLFGLVIYLFTKRSLIPTICAIIVYLSSPAILRVHSYAWSEVLFITFSLIAFLLFSLYIETKRYPWILAASAALGLAIATRYAGIAILPPVLIGLVLLGKRTNRQRLTDIIITSSIALFPLGVWLIRNLITAGTATNRTIAFNPTTLNHAYSLMNTLHDFLMPLQISTWIKFVNLLILACIFILALAIAYRQINMKDNINKAGFYFSSLSAFTFLIYIGFIFFSISFFDAHTPLDYRILLPVYVIISLSSIFLAWYLAYALNRPSIWLVFFFFLGVSVSINGIITASEAIGMNVNGIGYNSVQWNNSKTLALVDSFDEHLKIYSNGPDVIRFKTERNAVSIPSNTSAGTLIQNPNYENQIETLCTMGQKGEAIIIYLNEITWRWYQPTREEFENACNLPILYQTEDGTILGKIEN